MPTVYPQGLLLSILSSLSVILTLTPLIWHVKSRNIAASSLISWIIITNFFTFLNTLIWPNDNDIRNQWKGYGLCDVQSKIQIGALVAIPGAITAIMRDLCRVMDTRQVTLRESTRQKWINRVVTWVLCFGVPVYAMAVHYVVQNNRYYLFTISGCTAGVDDSWLGVVLIVIWPTLLAIIDAIYAALLIYRLYIYKRQFAQLISLSATTKARFLRLFALSLVLILVFLPTNIWILVQNLKIGVKPYKWSRTHPSDWGVVIVYPSRGQVIFDRWIQVSAGYVVFACFGLGMEAKEMYRGWWRACRAILPCLGRGKGQTSLPVTRSHVPTLNTLTRFKAVFTRSQNTSDNTTGYVPRQTSETTTKPNKKMLDTEIASRASISTYAQTSPASSPGLMGKTFLSLEELDEVDRDGVRGSELGASLTPAITKLAIGKDKGKSRVVVRDGAHVGF